MNREPAVITAAITGLVTAIVGLLVAFNIDVSDAQRDAIVTTIATFSTVIVLVGPLIRNLVYSPDSAKRIQNRAYNAGVPPTQPKPDLPAPADVR